jgi:rhodanese-related sulfurtransferase
MGHSRGSWIRKRGTDGWRWPRRFEFALISRRIIAGCLALGLIAWFAWPRLTWPVVNTRITREFPSVKKVGTAELGKELDSHERPVLLDVRTAAEFEVSHLPGAQHVDPEADAVDVKLAKDAPIVTYCSVGYRSARFADRLQKAGFRSVRNLEGSIFKWANEGRPLVNSRGPATTVHPYDSKWGRLLEPSRRANVPDAR